MVTLAALMALAGAAPERPLHAMDTYTSPVYGASSLTPAAQLDLVKELGYAGICWTVGEPAETADLARRAKQSGLRIAAIYAGATLRRTGLELDPRLPATMDALKGHGTLIWVHIGSPDYPASSPEGDPVAVEGLRSLAAEAARRKLRVALYPHVGDWVERAEDALRLAEAVDRPNLGVTYNLCHSLKMGEEARIPGILRRARPRLFMVTLNGADAGAPEAGWDRLIQTLDRGTYDVGAVLRLLDGMRYKGPIALQGYGIGGDPRDNLERSIAAWRKLTAAR